MNRRLAIRSPRPAFTLVELLVVVTIIVMLLALLVPAMERAIYAAEMAVCAARKHALGLGVNSYAWEHKRSYPYRAGVHEWPTWPSNVQRGIPRYDDRPMYRPYFALNATLNCPLIPEIDIDGSDDDCYAFSTYNLWFGFQYYRPVFNASDPADMKSRLKGMLKLGDRWEYRTERLPNQPLVRSSLLAAPRYFQQEVGGRPMSASHPGETYELFKLNNEVFYGIKYTLVRWDSSHNQRGPIDLNCLFADGAVTTYRQVAWENDDRTAMVGEYSDSSDPPNRHELVIKE